MATRLKEPARPFFLGIEGGGTRTVAILADAAGKLVRRVEVGPANLRLLSDAQLASVFESIAASLPRPDCLGIGLAGARTEADLRRIQAAAGLAWPSVPCHASDDLETALAAAEAPANAEARVMIISGTGSCCYGKTRNGKTAKVGGWGHVLGDAGSGYDIASKALRAVVGQFDVAGKWPLLGKRILRFLKFKEADDLIGWAQAAEKPSIAALAELVFAAAAEGDSIARQIVRDAATSLTEQATTCAGKVARRGQAVEFILAGSVLTRQPQFAKQVGLGLRKSRPRAKVSTLKREGAWGAVALARELWKSPRDKMSNRKRQTATRAQIGAPSFFGNGRLPPTEQANPRSANLDKMGLSQAIRLMLSEDAKIPAALLARRQEIERALRHIIRAFDRGGRLFYVGAGTSGRLGVLDASECPPTFGTPQEMVQGVIAGGMQALSRSVEGAEDDASAGEQEIRLRRTSRRDVVVGISASGRAPFVWGALDEAARRGAVTILLCFNAFRAIPGHRRPSVVISPKVGPEILAGSTRLKAGTATKLVLNIFTTLAMAKTGRVAGNVMARVKPVNAKLRERAVRIVRQLTGANRQAAEAALVSFGWSVERACASLSASKRA